MARTSAELTPEEILIIGDLVPVWSPWQVPVVNTGWTGLEYKTFSWGWDMLASTYDPAGWARQVSFACTTQTAITDYTFTGSEARDSGYLVTTASNRTVNINADLFTTGYEVSICKGTNNTNTVTIDAQTGNNINWSQTFVLTQYNEVVTLLKDWDSTWKIKSHYYPISGVNTGDNSANTTSDAYALTTPDFYKYSIVTSVASGNLTVALKNYEGNDPTATKPVKIQIGGVIRTITSDLVVVVTSWASVLDAGSSELATKEIDFFTHLFWYDTATPARVWICIARLPIVTDLSIWYLDEKGIYYDYDGSHSPSATTPVVNIGRFNATLSAGGAYTWSIPATSVIINRPIYETRVLQWGSQTGWTANNLLFYYKIRYDSLEFSFDANGTSNSTSSYITLPFSAKTIMAHNFALGLTYDNGVDSTTPWRADLYGQYCTLYKDSAYWAWTSSWSKIIRWQGHYYI